MTGGLGFLFKWNMGWMNDFLDYMRIDPLFKKGNHYKATFSLTYANSENYILVLSHDEVVHLKCSMINKMPGFMVDKFANLRGAYTFMFGHPGKKLLFMGQEFAMLSEWSEEKEIEWFLLKEPLHLEMQRYVKKLLNIYKKYPVLYAYDTNGRSFEWVNENDSDRSIFSFIRKNPNNYKGAMLFICNFTPIKRDDYCVGVPNAGTYKLLLSSHSKTSEKDTMSTWEKREKSKELLPRIKYKAVKKECDNLPYRLNIHLKPYEALIIMF